MLRALLFVGCCLAMPSAALAAEPEQVTIATWNLEWFFDHDTSNNRTDLAREQSAPSEAEWHWKRDVVATAVAKLKPTILAVQECEDRYGLFQLTKVLRSQHELNYREAFIEGNDFATEQDVGLLTQRGLVEFSRRELTAAQRADEQLYPIPKHLIARFEFGDPKQVEHLLVVNVHFRAMPEGAEIRQRQARLLRRWIDDALARGENVVVLGDINSDQAFEKTTADSELGILRGLATKDRADDLIDLHEKLPADERATHLHQAQYDRILVSPTLLEDAPDKVDLVFKSMRRAKDVCIRGDKADRDHWKNYYQIPQAERDVSDHYPLIAEFELR